MRRGRYGVEGRAFCLAGANRTVVKACPPPKGITAPHVMNGLKSRPCQQALQ
jgi:hypothetical protein